jgi:flagellar M-ring protein FliF
MSSGILDKLRQWWQSLGSSQKVLFTASCAGILVTMALLGQMLLRPAYAPLFTELEPQNAAKVIEQLESLQTPYRLTNNGKTIEVPKDQVYKLRIQMASAGALYANGAGFELFDEKKFGITEFEQHVGYQRALQEELRRTIVQLSEVEQARVHLVLPRESVFLDEQVTPSASIALKLKPFAKLEPNQVEGIQSLVMGSVQGLSPDNIHIIDMQGNVLNDAMKSGDDGLLSASTLQSLGIKRQYEKEMESRLQQMLNRILGPGRAVAMVSADMDFDREETVRTEFGPGSVLSEQTVTEDGSGGAGNGGIPGMDSEMPGTTMPLADQGMGAGSNYNREERTTNYQVDTTQQTLVKAPGTIRRLSVSVVVDGQYTQDQLDSIQRVIASAMGYDATRGDQLTVSGIEFNEAAVPSFEDTPVTTAATPLDKQLLIPGAVAGALLILLIAFFLFRRRARRRREMMLRQKAEEEALRRAAEEAKQPKEEIVIEEPQPGYRTLIKEIAREKPSDVVEILKVWLKE